MDYSENRFSQTLLTVTVVFLGLMASALAEDRDSDWLTLTSLRDVRQMNVINDTLYMATSGGLLAVTDKDSSGKKFLNTNGLGTVDITDIMVDSEGQKWVTGFGRLIKFDGLESRQYMFFDNANDLYRLLCVVDDGDQLWVGTEIALILFSKTEDGGQIEDAYALFGDLNPSPAVNDILLTEDTIWVATSAGLAWAERTEPNQLKAPGNWTYVGPADFPELGTGKIAKIISYESEILLAAESNLYRLDRSGAEIDLIEIFPGVSFVLFDIQVQNDSLFVFGSNGMSVYRDGLTTALAMSGLSSSPSTGYAHNGERWLAASAGGVFYQSGPEYVEYRHTGAPGNNVSDIAINRDGVLTVGLSEKGAAHYLDSMWYDQPIAVGERSTYLTADSAGNAWIGTFGNGMWHITDAGATNYDETNSSLRGNSDRPPAGLSYVVIHGLDTDGSYVYAACYRAVSDAPLVFGDIDRLDEPDGWGALGTQHGIQNAFVLSLDYHSGYVAIGTQTTGIYKCHVGSNPFGCSDDCCVHYDEVGWNLISDEIRVVKFAPDGLLWAGTNLGLAFFDPLASQQGNFVDVVVPDGFGPDIRALEFDRRGNVWVGSSNGLAFLNVTTGEKVHYTSVNSGLVADDVRNLTYDPYTGDLYIATTSGMSVLRSSSGPPTEDIDSVFAFPNPFVIGNGGAQLSLNYALAGTVSIFTVDGVLVDDFPAGETWDGYNRAGKAVASGVYLFVITGSDGDLGRGKFLLVREQ